MDRRQRLECQPLEPRELLTATVFLDFGDKFPAGGLTITDKALASTLDGPDLMKSSLVTGVSPNTNLTFTPLGSLVNFDFNGDKATNSKDVTDLESAVVKLVQHYFAPFNVNVRVASATSASDISASLADSGNDTYVMIGGVTAATGTIQTSLLGLSPPDDSSNQSNARDDTSVIFVNNVLLSNRNSFTDTALAGVVAHEAGHTFGLQHTNDSTPTSAILSGSDIMAQFANPGNTLSMPFFTRYPLPPGSHQSVTSNFVPYDVLARTLGTSATSPSFVTGTGADDWIVIQKDPSKPSSAIVVVQPFKDPGLTQSLGAPYTYTISTANGIDIQPGVAAASGIIAGVDKISIDARIQASVHIEGDGGNVQLQIEGTGLPGGQYQPAATNTHALDGSVGFGGAIDIVGLHVAFDNVASNSSVTVSGVGTFEFLSTGTQDVIAIGSPASGEDEVSGSTDKINLTKLDTVGVSTLIVDTGGPNAGTAADLVSIFSTAAGTNVNVITGPGNDAITVAAIAESLDSIQGSLSIDGGGGTNAITLDDTDGQPPTITPFAFYDITDHSVTRSFISPLGPLSSTTISYRDVGTSAIPGVLEVDGAVPRNDVWTIESTAKGAKTTLVGGAGNGALSDSFVVSPTDQNLDKLQGLLRVEASGPGSLLTLNDQKNPHTGAVFIGYTISEAPGAIDSLVRFADDASRASAEIDYQGVANVSLSTANASNIFHAAGLSPDVKFALAGNGANNLLIGPPVGSIAQENRWRVTGPNAGSLNGSLTFTGIASLVGDAGADRYEIDAGGSLSGSIRGGGLIPTNSSQNFDTLDYTNFNQKVIVNLGNGTATAIAGGVQDVENVAGGPLDDTITGDSNSNVLYGGFGADTLDGGTGRDMLIGGDARDTLKYDGDDIVIGGMLSLAAMTDDALASIMAEWTQPTVDFNTRKGHLIGTIAGGKNKVLLNSSTLIDDLFADVYSPTTLNVLKFN
jgi:hypothetical protein